MYFDTYSLDSSWFPRNGPLVVSSKNINNPNHLLTEAQILQLKNSAKVKNNLVRIRANVENQPETTTYSFVKACALYYSSLSEILSVYFDSTGSFMGVSVTSNDPTCVSAIEPQSSSLNTTVKVVTTGIGPVPDTQTYLQRMEQEKQEKLRGDKQDNRSFLAKYVSVKLF